MPAPHSTLAHPAAEAAAPLILEPVVGPSMAPLAVDRAGTTILGRASACHILLADEAVSRRHAQVHHTDGRWYITDLASRHGTFVNAIQLPSGGAAPLQPNDLVGIGPWTFRVRSADQPHASHITTDDRLADIERIERVQERELAAITQNRLNLLIKCATDIAGIPDEARLAKAIVAAAIEGTGFPRAAILRDAAPAAPGAPGGQAPGTDFEVVCERGPSDGAVARFSTSLLRAARSGEIAILTADSPMQGGASVISLGIRTAMCAPIPVGGTITTFLYLDARAGESGGARAVIGGFGGGANVQQDAAPFCQALSRMYGMAMGNIRRKELEDRQAQLERELNAARETQRLIMPPEEGSVGDVRYAMRMRSGRYVAGDLFDVVSLGDEPGGPVAIFLGDVAGKGIAAAILMATAQTHLGASLRVLKDPAAAVSAVNRHVCTHASRGRFISMWVGVFDPATRECAFVDAGHGHWLIASPPDAGGRCAARRPSADGALLVGVDADYPYRTERLTLAPGERIVVFSDGIVEQPDPDGTLFGLNAAIAALTSCNCPPDDVAALFAAVTAYAETDALKDDTTVASITFTTNAGAVG